MIPALEDKVKPTIYQTKTVMQKNETKARPASSYTLLSDANDLTPTAPSKHHSCCTQQPPSSASQKDGEQSAQAKSKRECSPQCIISASFPKVAPCRRKEKKAKTHTKSYHLCLPCPLPGNKVHVVRQKRPHLPSFALIHPRKTPFQPFLYTRKYLCMTPRNPKINSYSLVESQSPLPRVCVPSAP